MPFTQLSITEEILKALEEQGYQEAFDIQQKAIPLILEGNSVVATSHTGSGKTAAFAIPILQMSKPIKKIQSIILVPTKELAIQVRDQFRLYGKHLDLKISVLLGGSNPASQLEVLKKGIDILVVTPGRLLDLLKRKKINGSLVERIVIDEIDLMLSLGFLKDIKQILPYFPNTKQTLLFSATISERAKELALTLAPDAIWVQSDASVSKPKIRSDFMLVEEKDKNATILELIQKKRNDKIIVFANTKESIAALQKYLLTQNISCSTIYGDQDKKDKVFELYRFKKGKTALLLATDIAARGLDIKDITLVVNLELPEKIDAYLHRIGRTARGNSKGKSISFYTKKEEKLVEKIKQKA